MMVHAVDPNIKAPDQSSSFVSQANLCLQCVHLLWASHQAGTTFPRQWDLMTSFLHAHGAYAWNSSIVNKKGKD